MQIAVKLAMVEKTGQALGEQNRTFFFGSEVGRGGAFPCDVRRERGHSLVILEGREGVPL